MRHSISIRGSVCPYIRRSRSNEKLLKMFEINWKLMLFIIDDTRHFILKNNQLRLGLMELGKGQIGLVIGRIGVGIGLIELGIGLMELGIGLIELGIGLPISMYIQPSETRPSVRDDDRVDKGENNSINIRRTLPLSRHGRHARAPRVSFPRPRSALPW